MSSLRYCYHSHLSEAALRDPTEKASLEQGKLLRCARCKGAFYHSKEAQKQHWKHHKRTCSLPTPAKVSGMTLRECVDTLNGQMMNPATMDGNTVLVMKRTKQLLEYHDDDEDDFSGQDAGYKLHTMARNFKSDEAAAVYYSTLWAAPGMTQFLLSEPLWSTTVMARKVKYPNGVPDELEGLSEAERAEVHLWDVDEDLSAYHFAFLLFNILVHTAICSGMSPTSNKDGLGKVRGFGNLMNPLPSLASLAMAAGKRALALWLDADVRVSCGDALAPGPGLVHSLIQTQLEMQSMFPSTSKLFRFDVPFVPVIAACIHELGASTQARVQTEALMKIAKDLVISRRYSSAPLPDESPHATHLPVEEIPVVAELALHLIEPGLNGSDWKFALLDACWTTPKHRLKIWEGAAQTETHRGWDERAFFQFMLQKSASAALGAVVAASKAGVDAVFTKHKVPDVMVAAIALFAADPMAIDMKAATAEWNELAWNHGPVDNQTTTVPAYGIKQRCYKAVVPSKSWKWLHDLKTK
jgi:hypothetical protein